MSGLFKCRLVEEHSLQSPDDPLFERFLGDDPVSGMRGALADLLHEAGVDPGARGPGWARFRELAEPVLRADPSQLTTYPRLLEAFRQDPTTLTPDDLAMVDFQWMLNGLRAAVFPEHSRDIGLIYLRLELASASDKARIPPAHEVAPQRELLVRVLGDMQPRGHDTPVFRFLDAIDPELFFASLWQRGLGATLESASIGIVPFVAQGELIQLACGPDALAGRDEWWATDREVMDFATRDTPDSFFDATTYEFLVHPAWLPAPSARHPGSIFPVKAWFS